MQWADVSRLRLLLPLSPGQPACAGTRDRTGRAGEAPRVGQTAARGAEGRGAHGPVGTHHVPTERPQAAERARGEETWDEPTSHGEAPAEDAVEVLDLWTLWRCHGQRQGALRLLWEMGRALGRVHASRRSRKDPAGTGPCEGKLPACGQAEVAGRDQTAPEHTETRDRQGTADAESPSSQAAAGEAARALSRLVGDERQVVTSEPAPGRLHGRS